MAKKLILAITIVFFVSCKKTDTIEKECYTCKYRSSITSSAQYFDIYLTTDQYRDFNPNNSIYTCVKK